MSALILALALSCQPYNQAATELYRTGKPILVLVSTDRCPQCERQKATLYAMQRAGQLRGVSWVCMHHRHDAAKLRAMGFRTSSYPSIALVYVTRRGWQSQTWVGYASAAQWQRRIRGIR